MVSRRYQPGKRDNPPVNAGLDRQVVFVCQHGAFRSRIAAAYFNAAAPAGWEAVSAGVTPQSEVSERVVPLLAGTRAADEVDLGPPRPLADRADPRARIVAIDADVPGATTWLLSAEASSSDEALREEIQGRVLALVRELAAEGAGALPRSHTTQP